jgi:hypothetical protein
MFSSLVCFDSDGDRFAAADTKRCNAAAAATTT